MLCFSAMSMAQNTITGNVVNSDNEPLAFVNVLVKGTNIGATTDEEGNYSIALNEASEILVFSYLGYKLQSINIKNKRIINVVLQDDSEVLNEVVLTALGVKRSTQELGYVVQSLDTKGVTEVKSVNFLDNLISNFGVIKTY